MRVGILMAFTGSLQFAADGACVAQVTIAVELAHGVFRDDQSQPRYRQTSLVFWTCCCAAGPYHAGHSFDPFGLWPLLTL